MVNVLQWIVQFNQKIKDIYIKDGILRLLQTISKLKPIPVYKKLLEKPAISLPLVNSAYEMDISCYLVLLLTLIYILYQLHYQIDTSKNYRQRIQWR